MQARLFNVPLGTRFQYLDDMAQGKTFVLLSHEDCGLVADFIPVSWPSESRMHLQGLYSAAESRTEYETMQVEVIQ